MIVEGKPKPQRGYFWLASQWEKLFPSCIDCNRVRTHTIAPSGEVLLQIHQRIYTIRALTRVLDTTSDPTVADIVEELIEHEMRALLSYERSDRPDALMARQAIAAHMDALQAAEDAGGRRRAPGPAGAGTDPA